MTRPTIRTRLGLAVVLLSGSVIASSCSLFGGGGGGSAAKDSAALTAAESGLDEAGAPQRGGELVYGLEAEATKGYCLPEAELSISGMQVARALYDTLTVPDAKGGYAPYLAKSVDHDDTYRVWTITLRSGVTFHDGTALDATVVKNNLDAYRGSYKGRSPLLFSFVFANVQGVRVLNELTVEVTTKKPWVAFPAVLYSSGRLGIMAQSQLDADAKTCAERPVGTGPFSFVSWTKNESLKVKRYEKYWYEAPDGKPYPYLNAIDFRPMPNSDARIAALQEGELNMLHTSTAADMVDTLTQLRDQGRVNLLVSEDRTEVAYLMINSSKGALGQRAMRLAIAQAIDRKKLNEDANRGFPTIADGPFAPQVLGYLQNTGFPGHDAKAAAAAVKRLRAAGADTRLTLLTSSGPVAVRQAQLQKEMLEAAGFRIDLDIEAEADLIDKVIKGDYELASFRNQPGEDPDMDYLWWYGNDNPVNFGRFDDPVINANLDIGRSDPDPVARKAAYEKVNREFAKQVWNVWLWYAPWAVAEASNVHGILGPDLPGDGGPPSTRLVTGHSLLGVWIDRS
jgi:peptide/nickel transport system substrate-binding protein